MTRFIIYLFETGLCLSLLYLAYWLFLRRETYFNFNRIFLVGSLVLALSLPILHLNFILPIGSSLKNTAMGIVKFRDYYEELVYMIDADFGTEPGLSSDSGGNASDGMGIEPTSSNLSGNKNGRLPGGGIAEDTERQGRQVSISRILLFIYIGGVMYFFVRFVYLVIRLYLLALKNGVPGRKDSGWSRSGKKSLHSPFSAFCLSITDLLMNLNCRMCLSMRKPISGRGTRWTIFLPMVLLFFSGLIRLPGKSGMR